MVHPGPVALVGRAHELAVAGTVLQPNGPRAVIVAGPAGIGKTRLLDELARRAVPARWSVEHVTATPSNAVFPLAPFVHVTESAQSRPRDPADQIGRLVRTLVRRAGNRRLLMLVDDAPHLDPASLVVVHQLVVRDRARVALTARDDTPVPDAIAALAKDGLAEVMELAPLPRPDADQLVAALLGARATESAAAAIWRLAAGNPLFTRELTLWGRYRGAIAPDGHGAWELREPLATSPVLRDQIGRRLGQLEPAQRSLLVQLSIAGPLRLEMVERMTDLEIVAALERCGLVLCAGEPGARLVRAAHPLYAEVARDLTPVSLLPEVERAVSDALVGADRPRPQEIVLAARLRLQTGPPDPALFLRAATIAIECNDHEHAVLLSTAALEAEASADARLVRARALSTAGRADEAEAEFTALAELDRGPEWIAAVTAFHAEHLLFRRGRPEQANVLVERRVARVPRPQQARLRTIWSTGLLHVGDVQRAVDVSRSLDDDVSVETGVAIADALVVRGAAAAGLDLCERLLTRGPHTDVWPGAGAYELLTTVFIRLLALWQTGRAREGDDPFAPIRGIRGGAEIPSAAHEAGMGRYQAFVRGHLDDAARGCAADGGGAKSRFALIGAFNATVFATVEAMRGNTQGAGALLDEVDAARPTERAGFGWWVARARVWTVASAGNHDRAADLSLALAEQHAAELFHRTTSLHDLVRLGRPDLAVEPLDRQVARDEVTWWDHECAAHAHALLDGSPTDLVDVAQHFEGGGLDLHAAEALAQAMRLLAERGDSGAAARAGAHLTGLLVQCGQVRTAALADTPALLTPRELEVARLAGGLSTREIATRLGTSPRTVGNQLQAVYDKLALHHRTELGALFDP